MFHTRYLIFLHLIVATPQINLYYTDWVSDNALQHTCLRVGISIEEANDSRQILSYCMSESPSTFDVKNNDFLFPKFTFAELSKQNITSQQLYLWSTPIDIVEHYQFYLNQLNDESMASQVFYNCTMPRFGSMCQYEIEYYHPNHSSLHEMIRDFYRTYEYEPTNLTCYIHMQCYRGPSSACLDWSEICDGKVDCLDGEFDEEHCWQLEINSCNDNEYRCKNGQCIPQAFYRDNIYIPDCLDASDENLNDIYLGRICKTREPSFGCEDITCEYTPFTSSCVKQRKEFLVKALFSIKDNSISDDCWSAFKCLINIPNSPNEICNDLCQHDMCVEIIKRTCPDMLYIPIIPVLFGHIYFAYEKSDSEILNTGSIQYPYVCYNNSFYDKYFVNETKVLFNNTARYRMNEPFQFISTWFWDERYLLNSYEQLRQYNQISVYPSTICNRSNMYQCNNSLKCISTYRVGDYLPDCPEKDDENLTAISINNLSEELPGISSWYDDELKMKLRYVRKNISFQHICDGFTELLPIIIKGQNETDETQCEQWQCNNIYTHCNGLWNCLNGADEVGCNLLSPKHCSLDHHICVSPDTNQFICLPVTKANDGKIDCLGAIDEPALCRKKYELLHSDNFYCMKGNLQSCVTAGSLCNARKDCEGGDDEQFCETNRTVVIYGSICGSLHVSIRSDVEQFLCENAKEKTKEPLTYFSLDKVRKSARDLGKNIENIEFSSSSIIQMSRCHRGLDVRVRMNDEEPRLTNYTCLCPPSFYGDQCQYQNERVSLTIQFRALSDSWQTLFAIIISLIDDSNERIIHSYEQFTYLSVRDCKIKFNVYLIYSTRPKNATNRYSIHIDIYEKISLIYRGSLLLPITFPFLPVHRLAFIVDIPRSDDNTETCSDHRCLHGKCIKYSNNDKKTSFCQCNRGWSGRYCTIPHNCRCSSDSLCIGVSANNRSICVCPIHKLGSRCLLLVTVCQTNNNSLCQNDGQCVPTDEYIVSNQKFVCICPKGYTGERCETEDTKLILSFEKNIVLSQSIFIHFIEVINNSFPMRSTTFRTILVKQDSLIIYWPRPFHLVFIELFSQTYYLAVVQKTYNRSITHMKMINSLDRCQHISELFNETFIQFHLLRRIKYYHLPCQNDSLSLSCFHDDVHLCLCYNYGQKRLANCLDFNHNMTFDCLGQSACENGGHCFQDTQDCPQRSMCVCPSCFYGTRCQFSTSGLGLSLDAILGYHILPHLSITHQPRIVKISLALTIIFCMAGLINGVLSIITFKNKGVREVGCGLYLLSSSITTLLTTVMFGLKFWILLVAQMTLISNRSFLQIQCISFDFLLRVCVHMDQCLYACVATERAVTVIKGARFNKKKSKQAARLVIVILLFVLIGTSLHDPIYRRLIDEEYEDEKRIWCIVSYPSSLQTYNSVMYTFYFFVPFIINLISAIILITKKSRQQSHIQPLRPYNELLREQFLQHKHLLIAPLALVILALPRLIIYFPLSCMKSAGDSWLFLVGYFISFIPSMLTFVIFILPSTFYKKQLRKIVARYRTNIIEPFGT